jgi:hypothetical protein
MCGQDLLEAIEQAFHLHMSRPRGTTRILKQWFDHVSAKRFGRGACRPTGSGRREARPRRCYDPPQEAAEVEGEALTRVSKIEHQDWDPGLRAMMELVPLRISFHNQCRSCMAVRYLDAAQDGADEELIGSLERPMEAEDLGDRERLATNHLSAATASSFG